MYGDKEELYDAIKEIIVKTLKRDTIDIDWESEQLYRDLAIDSLEAITIIVEIENLYGIEMSDEDLGVEIFSSLATLSAKVCELREGHSDTVS